MNIAHDELRPSRRRTQRRLDPLPDRRPRGGSSCRRYLDAYIFDHVCAENGIEHELGKPYQPWTNGQAGRTGRIVKDATLNAFHCPSVESLKAHVIASVSARDAKHLKAPGWRTHFDAVCHAGTITPDVFKLILATSLRDQTPSQMQGLTVRLN